MISFRRFLTTPTSHHIEKAMNFLIGRGYDEKVSRAMLDSLKRAGISDSAMNGVLLSLGGTGSVRFLLFLMYEKYT
jgi:hypothetical protein